MPLIPVGIAGLQTAAVEPYATPPRYALTNAFVCVLVDSCFYDKGRLKKMLIHCIDAEERMRELDEFSKLSAGWDFLMLLHELGRARGEAFLNGHCDKLEREPSTSTAERFLRVA